MHLTESFDACLLIVCFIALPMLLNCKSEARRAPANLMFAFGDEYSLIKRGDYITINRAQKWTDSQIPPPQEFDRTTAAVLILPQDLDSLWSLLNRAGLAAFGDPGKLEFHRTPPGMDYVEVLTYVVDGDTIVNWSRPYEKLAAPVREPLDELTSQLASIYAKRNTELVLPSDLELHFHPAESREFAVALSDNAASVILAGRTKSVPKSRFEQFWRSLVDLRLLNREFSTFSSAGTGATTFELSLRVNKVECVGGRFVSLAEDKPALSALRQALEALAKE